MNRKEKVYAFMSQKDYKPLTISEMAAVLCVPKKDYPELDEILCELIKEGKVIKNKKGRFKRAGGANVVYGTMRLTKASFGFVVLDSDDINAKEGDIFIEKNNINYALDGDRVAVRLLRTPKSEKAKSREGVVIKILERGHSELVGTIVKDMERVMFVPDNSPNILSIISKDAVKAKAGQKVVAKVLRYPDEKHLMKVSITEILGSEEDVSVLCECIVREQKIPVNFSEKTIAFAKQVKSYVTEEEKEGRVDFKADRVITIDGEDARDLDDAVCVKKHPDGSFTLFVHIADVSHYVEHNSPVDMDAYERATSVYLPDRVISMLPKELSNGICSLNEGEDRLVLSMEMQIDKEGVMTSYELCEGVICSSHRMTYTDVEKILNEDKKLCQKYADIVDDLNNMKELAMLLKRKKEEKGAIDFNFPEPKVIIDNSGNVSEVKMYETGVSNEIIEQFMLLANEAAARYSIEKYLPFIYRVHEPPSSDKLSSLKKYLALFGIEHNLTDEKEPKPRDIQKIVNSIRGTQSEQAIATLCLRSMMKARYSTESLGHFGLALEYYSHFTSPIRRYPDLAIHRILHESMKGKLSEKRKEQLGAFVLRAADISSEAEIRATEAERAADKACACLYMSQFIGEEFDAVISSVTEFGFFVTVKGCIEGLVSMTLLSDDFYIYDEELFRIKGERGGREFSLGDSVRVRLVSVDARLRRIDFEVSDMKKSRPIKKNVSTRKKQKNYSNKSTRRFVSKKSRKRR